MKKYLLILVILFLSVGFLFSSDASEVWSRLYNRVTTLDQKYTIMQKIVVMNDPSMELMLTLALEELVQGEYYNQAEGATFRVWQDLVMMIIQELGDIKAQDAADLVRIVMRDYDGLLKAEAMIALGSMGALEYTQDLITVLRNLNFNTNDDRELSEIEAYGAIVGLKRMGQIEGFETVFYAHLGWYSRRTKDVAAQTLLEMVEDPSDEIIKILGTASFEERNIALDVEARSNASIENKNRVAAYALEIGVSNVGNNVTEETELRNLRVRSMVMLGENQASLDETIPHLERSYREADVMEEKLASIVALAINGSDSSVGKLIEFLDHFNERKLSGINPNNEEQQLIRQILYGLGISGNEALATPALSQIEIYDYSNSIERSARAALENYQ